MSNTETHVNTVDEALELKIRPRETETVSIQIPKDTLQSLEHIAKRKDMALPALLRFYIGKGLRNDLSQSFAEHLLDSTARVLTERNYSEEEVADIIHAIQVKR